MRSYATWVVHCLVHFLASVVRFREGFVKAHPTISVLPVEFGDDTVFRYEVLFRHLALLSLKAETPYVLRRPAASLLVARADSALARKRKPGHGGTFGALARHLDYLSTSDSPPVQKVHSYQTFRRIVRVAIPAGAQTGGNGSVYWNISNNCQKPFRLILKCHNQTQTGHLHIDIDVRCRKCSPCLKARAASWRIRMTEELRVSARTWLVTLTLGPAEQSAAEMRAIHHVSTRGLRWEEIDDTRRHSERHRQISPEITRFLKRVRERAGAPLRYCLVCEKHKSGYPHYHMLLHEVSEHYPVRYRQIVESWRVGFAHAKLIAADQQGNPANYVSKYLAKEAAARLRASRGYGAGTQPTTASAKANSVDSVSKVIDPQQESVEHWLDFIASQKRELMETAQ